MAQQTALVLGATGLIGNTLLHYLLHDDTYGKVIVLSRSVIHYSHPKLEVRVVNFKDVDTYSNIPPGDTIFCCIGTTMRNVKGDKTLYRHIDYEIPTQTATAGIEKGYTKYVLVSAVGANTNAGNFYLKLKGETEAVIGELPFEAVHIFRPSLLLGKRLENRLMEQVAQVVMPVFSMLLVGGWSKYKPVKANEVAKAMIAAAASNAAAVQLHYYNDIQQLAGATP